MEKKNKRLQACVSSTWKESRKAGRYRTAGLCGANSPATTGANQHPYILWVRVVVLVLVARLPVSSLPSFHVVPVLPHSVPHVLPFSNSTNYLPRKRVCPNRATVGSARNLIFEFDKASPKKRRPFQHHSRTQPTCWDHRDSLVSPRPRSRPREQQQQHRTLAHQLDDWPMHHYRPKGRWEPFAAGTHTLFSLSSSSSLLPPSLSTRQALCSVDGAMGWETTLDNGNWPSSRLASCPSPVTCQWALAKSQSWELDKSALLVNGVPIMLSSYEL